MLNASGQSQIVENIAKEEEDEKKEEEDKHLNNYGDVSFNKWN